MATDAQIKLQMKRLDAKGIKKAMDVAKRDIGDCSSVILIGDRTVSLPEFVDPKNTRDLTSGNKMVTLFDMIAGIVGVKKQSSVYQDIRGRLIAGDYKDTPAASVPTSSVPVAAPKMAEKELPKNVLEFKADYMQPIPRPRGMGGSGG